VVLTEIVILNSRLQQLCCKHCGQVIQDLPSDLSKQMPDQVRHDEKQYELLSTWKVE